jgi:hypothetical protein
LLRITTSVEMAFNWLKPKNVLPRLIWLAVGVMLGILLAQYEEVLRLLRPSPKSLINSRIFLDANINELVSIHDQQEAVAKRAELVNFIWGSTGVPKELPAKVENNISDERYAGLPNLKQIDRLTVTMDWGFTSSAYHFTPVQGNGKLFVYHGGHDGDFIAAKDLFAIFLKNGFGVLALSMPLEAPNNQPVVELQGIGKIQLVFHDQLKLLKMKSGHPVQLFLTPITVCLNHLQSLGYQSIYMTGVSGGGWTTTIYAALDPRITRSYPVAGSLPLHLREDRDRSNSAHRAADWGDYEQAIPELHAVANYLDLYILSSFGAGRKQLQILNKYDPCCLAGETFRTYESVVNDRVRALGGGTFAVYLDTKNPYHSVSHNTVDVILNDINNN